ncbi:MAG: hypothetical protein ACUVRO_08360 [Armatimonadota bacterium]
MRDPEDIVEIDCPVDVDDLHPNQRVRVLLQKCPHCGEWTAGPLGDDERYFCCGETMDPFVEVAGEVEIVGRVKHIAGGGSDLREMVELLTDEDRKQLTDRWMAGEDWISLAEELVRKRRAESPPPGFRIESVPDLIQSMHEQAEEDEHGS